MHPIDWILVLIPLAGVRRGAPHQSLRQKRGGFSFRRALRRSIPAGNAKGESESGLSSSVSVLK